MTRRDAADAPGNIASNEHPSDLAGALHEVSNALTVVLGWLEAARDRLPEGAGRNAVEIARVHARLGHAIARRAIGGDVGDEHARQPASTVARDAVLGLKQEAARRKLTIAVDSPASDAFVDDAPSVLQVLLNLLLNAIQFSPEGGTVRVKVASDGEVAIFVVTDEGPGIPPERARTLFSTTDSGRRGGAGVGLRYCKAVAERAGGDLVHVPAGRGARFELLWPVAEALSSRRPPRPGLDTLEGKRILVLEDERAVISLVELALQRAGATVLVASTLDELEALGGAIDGLDAALVDLSPIAADPIATLVKLRASSPDLRVVMISGTAIGVPRGTEGHVDRWVRKPFAMDELVLALLEVAAPG